MNHAAATPRVKFRQHRLLPSGCMQRKGFNNLHVVGGDVNGKYFAFCSTLAVYVYDITSFQLHRLLSTADNLAGLAWCSSPQHGHWLATVSLSQKVVLYDVETEQILYHVLLPYHPVSFQWHPSSLQLVVATSDPSGKTSAASTLVGWTIDHTNRSTSVTTLQRGNTGMLASPSAITVIRFNTAGTLAIGFENGNLAIYTAKSPTLRLLDKKKTSKKQSTGAPPGSPTANAIIDLQWDPLSTIYLLIATRDGHCALWEVTDDTGTPLHTFDKQGSGTSAVAWLPWGSGLFVTANARTGNLKLWNVSQSTPLEHVRVRPSGVGIHALALLPSTQHVLCASSDGSVALYHVPRRQLAWQSQAGHKETIFDLRFQPQSAQVLATCGHDGAVRVWNTSTMECTHHLQPQDVGGIAYSVAWSPSNANRLVSASSLGTVYVWDLAGTLAPASQLTHHTDAVYCVAWRQPSANNAKSMLASSSKDKSVVIFYDAVTSSASPSREAGHLPLYIVRRYGLPCSAYGCAWRPGNSGVLAVGGGDHVVRLFDVDNTDMDTPLRVLAAHEARVFHTVWSPHQSTHAWLATSSDDCTVRVWTLPPPKGLQAPPPPRGEGGRTEAKESKDADEAAVVPYVTLKGHSNFVRALVWSSSPSTNNSSSSSRRHNTTRQKQQRGDDQVADGGNDDTAERSSHCSQPWSRTPPPLLLSGSWDGTIRIWDVERRECCVVVSDHLADVYGIATHPQAPSVFVSCSRDTTVRFWGLTTSATDQVVLQMMLQMTSAPSSREEMAELAAVVAAQSSAASSGVTNLMALLQENNMGGTKGSPSAVEPAKSTTTTATMVVPAEGQLLAVALEHARRLECGHGRRSKPTKLNQRDAVREAATQYLKAGAVQKYCQLLVEVEDWEAALAMAPAVSIEFWRQLAAKYADVLQAKQDESAVMYYLATHQVAKAVDVLQGRGQFNDACVVAKAHPRIHDVVAATPPVSGSLDCGTVTFPPVSSPSPPFETASPKPKAMLTTRFNTVDDQVKDVEDDNCSTPNPNKSAHEVAGTRLLHKTFTWLADLYSDRGEPVLAACCHLAVAQVLDAIDRLVRGDELELAWMLSRWYDLKPSDVLVAAVVGRCEVLGDGALALSFANLMACPEKEMALVYVRLNRPKELQELAQVANVEKLEDSLEAFVSACQVVEAIQTCLVLDRVPQAIEMATTHLQAALSTSSLSVASSPTVSQKQLLLDVTYVLRSSDLSQVDTKPRALTLAYMALAGALRAMDARYPLVLVSYLMQLVHTQVHSYNVPFPVATTKLLLLEAQYASRIDIAKASLLVTQLSANISKNETTRLEDGDFCDEVEALQRHVQAQPRDRWLNHAYTTGTVVVSGAKLPSAGQTRNPIVSILTGEVVHGPFVRLEDEVSALTLEEAIMWHRVNPFSPLCTGDKLRFD